jgi:hypothetical protein
MFESWNAKDPATRATQWSTIGFASSALTQCVLSTRFS